MKLTLVTQVFSRILCLVNGYTMPILRVRRDAQRYLNALRAIEGNYLKSVLTCLLCIKFNEIYARYSDSQ